MTAYFYNISCPQNVVDKLSYLGSPTDKTIEAYEPIDDLSGYIYVSSDVANSNYVMISNLTGKDRYFFISSREPMPGGRCRLTLEEDTLMTWNYTVMHTPCIVGRSGVGGMKDMGGDIPTMAYSRISEQSTQYIVTAKNFEYGTLSSMYFVLFSACSGNVAATARSNSDLLPYKPDEGDTFIGWGGTPRG